MPRILAVDDSPDQLLALELHLRRSGFEVETVTDGYAAVERCKVAEFDLVLLDVRMPGIDGFEVSRRLKAHHRTAFTPIIFLSGNLPSESARRDACEQGAVDFVQKPFDRDELVARIQLMLRLQEVRQRLTVENARLGRDLDRTQRELTVARTMLNDLLRLGADAAAGGLAVVDAGGVVLGVDARAARLWPRLQPAVILRELGDAGRELAALVTEPGSDRVVDVDDGIACVIVALGGGLWALWLTDRRAGASREQLVHARAAAVSAPAAGALGYRLTEWVGEAAAVRAVTAMVDRLRRGRTTVLVHGETGTGKELVARALHFDGPNPNAPFIPIHCGAITRDLIESELFGFEKGAFTGAQQSHDGLFGAADGGTIFLDEIAETSLELQVKLLRVLQRGEIRRVGSTQHRIVDVRIVAATHRDLRQLIAKGRFREDLYHRLGVVTLHLPPLRERREDLPLLVARFLERGNERHDRGAHPVRGVTNAALARLLAHDWPGNVRELENVIERAFALGVGALLQAEDLPEALGHAPAPSPAAVGRAPAGVLDLRSRREGAERAAIQQALNEAEGDKGAAARALGLPRSTFYRRLRELGL